MSYAQFAGYSYPPGTAALPTPQMSSSVSGASGTPRACCENGRPIMTDPHTGQTICSCQYSSAILNYSRVSGLPEGVYGASAYAAAAASQGYVPLGSEGSAFYSPLTGSPYDVKDSSEAWRSLAQPGSCFPYDPSMAVYPYGTGYGGLDLNARRKNATRETTNTLKAWLYEHRKNPYPTKGEKIMLAIITKMTLTQVSTWFANARRRLKKENKMTWSPRNRSEDGGDNDDDNDDDNKDDSFNLESAGSPGSTDENAQDDKEDGKADMGKDRIISVDDEDSNHSIKRLEDLDPLGENENSRNIDVGSPVPSVGLGASSGHPSPSESRDSDSMLNRLGQPESEQDTPARPKIWSVSDFLVSASSTSESSSASNVSSSAVITVTSQQGKPLQSPGTGYYYLPSTSHSWGTGRYNGLGSYPFPLSHTSLSYPYTISSRASTKSHGLGTVSVAAGVGAVDGIHREAGEKLLRPQNGLFSPARDLDVIRPAGLTSSRLLESTSSL